MRTPYSPHEADSVLPGLFIVNETVEDVSPQAAGDEEAWASSESDAEGDLVLEENARAMPGTSSRQGSGDGVAEIYEQLFVDGDGGIHREHVLRGSRSGPSIEGDSNKNKERESWWMEECMSQSRLVVSG